MKRAIRLHLFLLVVAASASVHAKSRVVNEIVVSESGDLGVIALHQQSFRAWLDDPDPTNYKSYDWSTSKSYSNPIAVRITDGEESQLFANLYPGSNYTWKVGRFSGTFTTEEQAPRTVSAYYGDEEMVWNFRDLGGWHLVGSRRRAKYGVFYRSSYWVEYDTEAKRAECPMNSEFGIRCHIDLRADSGYSSGNAPTYSPAMPSGDTSVRFFNYGVDQHFQKPGSGYSANYGKIFQTLGQQQFRPAVFHCAGGLDRTETVAFFIEALCGVEWDDILRDDVIGAFRQGRPSNVSPSELRKALFSDVRYEKYGSSLAGHTRAYLEELGVNYGQIAEITMAYVGELPETVLARVEYFEEHGERLPEAMDHGDEAQSGPVGDLGWDAAESVGDEVTAAELWDSMPDVLASSSARKLAAWAKLQNVEFANAGTIRPEAFLLNCGNDDGSIANATKEFRFASFKPGTVPSADDFRGFNGIVHIEGRRDLVADDWGPAESSDRFFRAVLDLK